MSDIHPLYRQRVAKHRLARSVVDGHAVIIDATERILLGCQPPDVPPVPERPRQSWWQWLREKCGG